MLAFAAGMLTDKGAFGQCVTCAVPELIHI